MKYVVLVGDGMADRPLKKLGYKTCLQKASTPNMDKLASGGEIGKARTVPVGFDPGSDVANLSILGYNPSKYYSGRAPIEAEYRGIDLGPEDVAFRCNLVSLGEQSGKKGSSEVMTDYSAGHITTKEASVLIRDINKKLGDNSFSFYPGMSYRHLMIWKGGIDRMQCTPPHDISGRRIYDYLPSGKGGDLIMSLMEKSAEILRNHPVNIKRVSNGQNPASSIWLWGQGKKLTVPEFYSKYKLRGALISAVDLTKGLGLCAGFKIINVKGATGYIDTNYDGKAKAALRALKEHDIVYVHVEAPDEAGHNGDVEAKLKAIEDFDKKIVGAIMTGLKKFDEYSVLLMPDHYTPISMKTHTEDPVPFVIYRNTKNLKSRTGAYTEYICRMKNILEFEKGYKLMDYFVRGK